MEHSIEILTIQGVKYYECKGDNAKNLNKYLYTCISSGVKLETRRVLNQDLHLSSQKAGLRILTTCIAMELHMSLFYLNPKTPR